MAQLLGMLGGTAGTAAEAAGTAATAAAPAATTAATAAAPAAASALGSAAPAAAGGGAMSFLQGMMQGFQNAVPGNTGNLAAGGQAGAGMSVGGPNMMSPILQGAQGVGNPLAGSTLGQGVGQFGRGLGQGLFGLQPTGLSGYPGQIGNFVGGLANQSQGNDQQRQMQVLMQLLGGLRR